MKFAFVFPGQGSQSVGMMGAYGEAAVIRDTFNEASSALGRDLWAMVAEGPSETINLTVNTQPLMLTAGVAVFRFWRHLGGGMPAVMAGHSLGEYSALVSAGVLPLGDAVRIVELRAKAMQDAVPQGAGAMAAVMGLEVDKVRTACADVAGDEIVEAVNFNDPSQTVIAGHKAAVERAAEAVKVLGAKRAIMLPVSAPFHCSLMKPAAEALDRALRDFQLFSPTISVVNNVDVAVVSDAVEIKRSLVRQAAAPVRWVETMLKFEEMGVTHIFECGPGKVLSGLVKRCSNVMHGAAMNDIAGLRACLTLSADEAKE